MKFMTGLFLIAALAGAQPRGRVRSNLTVIDIESGAKRVVFTSERLFEAPNWSHDGKWLIVNSDGKLWRIPSAGGGPEQIRTASVKDINNDHGISFDGSQLAISADHIYTLPLGGGSPRKITNREPSYFHGWSPDGKWVAYCAERAGNFDIYRTAVSGDREEERLTVHPGYDDGPEYSPDGRWIYFNSDRSKSWDIWRIPSAGAGPDDAKAERITTDDMEDWFPHLSPDGRWIVFLSFSKGTEGHPPNRDVVLRLMPVANGEPDASRVRVLVRLFGGQGTINVNSWASDSRRFAYIAYEKME